MVVIVRGWGFSLDEIKALDLEAFDSLFGAVYEQQAIDRLENFCATSQANHGTKETQGKFVKSTWGSRIKEKPSKNNIADAIRAAKRGNR